MLTLILTLIISSKIIIHSKKANWTTKKNEESSFKKISQNAKNNKAK